MSRSRDAVEQFVKAMQYKDLKNGYFMCRIFDAYSNGAWQTDDGIWCADVSGDCAWSVGCCMIDTDYGNWRGMDYLNPHFSVWRDMYTKEICYSNIGVTAPMLCKFLGCSFECWSKESGCEFQEHYVVNSLGVLLEDTTCDWSEGYDEDEDGDYVEPNPEKDKGGFSDYGSFEDPASLIVEGDGACRR